MNAIAIKDTKILNGQISVLDIDGISGPIIQLNAGRYSGAKYQYGKVEFGGNTEDGDVEVHFGYQVFYNADHDVETDEFRNYIGDILCYIITISTAKTPEDLADWSDFNLF